LSVPSAAGRPFAAIFAVGPGVVLAAPLPPQAAVAHATAMAQPTKAARGFG
jgi:hypothetical protein